MTIDAAESSNVTLIGHHDLDRKPGFKLAIERLDGRWLLYVAHLFHSGWSILDVTEPTAPQVVRFIEGPSNTTTKQIQVADGTMVTSYERPAKNWGTIDGERFDPTKPYKAGVAIWDLTADPTDPTLEAEYLIGGRGTHRNFYDGGDYVYLCASPEGFEPTRDDPFTNPVKSYYLSILDISDQTDPTEVSNWMFPGQDPDDPTEKETSYFHGPAYVQGDRAYLSYGRVGIVTLDVADPTDPTMLYSMDVGPSLGSYNGTHSFVPLPGTDLAAINSEGVSEETPLERDGDPLQYTLLLDISDGRRPEFVGKTHRGPRIISAMPLPIPEPNQPYPNYYEKPGWFGPHNQHHPRDDPNRFRSDEYLFVTYFNAGLRIFDISDPLAPFEAGYYVPETPDELIGGRRSSGMQFEDVLVDSRGYAYCTDPQRGVYILESDLV